MNKRILIIAPGNKAKMDEAWSKEIKDLSASIPSIVLTCGDITGIYRKIDNYIILKNNFIFYPLFCLLTSVLSLKYGTVLLECSPQTIYFNVLVRLIGKNKVVYRIKSYSWIDPGERISRRTYQQIKNFRNIIVCSKKSYKSTTKYLPANKVYIVTPGIFLEKYPYCSPPIISNSFKILFASAPLSHHKYPEIFELKGINILLNSIKYINENLGYNIKLYMLWRNAYTTEIEEKVTRMGFKDNVIIVNETVNVVDYYKKCHATIFPATDAKHSPDFPSSIMESLSIGRPVVVSNIIEVSEIISQTKSGVICEPNETDLTIAIQELIKNYNDYTKSCNYAAQSNFSIENSINMLKDVIRHADT